MEEKRAGKSMLMFVLASVPCEEGETVIQITLKLEDPLVCPGRQDNTQW